MRSAEPLSHAATVPVEPDGAQAREWARTELADPAYDITEPTGFDRFARAVGDVLAALFSGEAPAAIGPWAAAIAGLIAIGVIVAAVLVWGRPRRLARGTADAALFGDDEHRTAAALRADADAAAQREAWNDAIAQRFRALARGLDERTLVALAPGSTAHGFARAATAAFPGEHAALDAAAATFDDVRYLRRPGSAEAYRAIAALDDRLATTRPALAEAAS